MRDICLGTAPHKFLCNADIAPLYRLLRWQIFIGIVSVMLRIILYKKSHTGNAISFLAGISSW